MPLNYKDKLKQIFKVNKKRLKNEISFIKNIFVFQYLRGEFAMISGFWQLLVRLCLMVSFPTLNMFILQKPYHVSKTYTTLLLFIELLPSKLCFSTSFSWVKKHTQPKTNTLCILRFCSIWQSNNYNFLATLK